ncbi:MAG: universal stress protein [Pseudobdellovibrionaceae bacterium]
MKSSSIKTLVVGVDFSEYSDLVSRQAKQLAIQMDLPVVYVFVYEEIDLTHKSIPLDRNEVTQIYEVKLRSHYELDPQQKVLVRFGRAEKELLKVASKEKNPLILVGHQSGHSIARFFLGSVAENLAVTTTFPLWIHRGDQVVRPRKILIPSDLSTRSDKTIQQVRGLKKAFEFEIEIYHVLNQPLPILDYKVWAAVEKALQEADQKKIENFKKKHPSLKLIKSRGGIAESIEEHSKKFDLIALSPRTKTKASFGRVTGKIVRSGSRPVLVLP